MTLRNRCVIAILSILLALPALLRAEKPAGENKFLPRTFRLKAQLSLTNEQTARVEKLMKMVKSQTENDRQVFKGNSLALLEAAKRREQMVETHIGNLLTSEQTPVFKGLLKSKKARQEMFILRESLALNAKQIAAVEVILDKYREKLKKEFMELRRNGGGGNAYDTGSLMRNDMPNDPMNRNRNPGMARRQNLTRRNPLADKLEILDNQKAKEIKKLLTAEQKKMYIPILKMREREMEKKKAEIREQRNKQR